MTTSSEWVERFAAALRTAPPDQEEIDALLGLAGIAAHASERTAAPLSTWLAARAGVTAADAQAIARRVAAEMGAGDRDEAGPRAEAAGE